MSRPSSFPQRDLSEKNSLAHVKNTTHKERKQACIKPNIAFYNICIVGDPGVVSRMQHLRPYF